MLKRERTKSEENIYSKFGNMSRLAKKPIQIPEGVTVERKDGFLNFKGPKGEKSVGEMQYVDVDIVDKNINVKTSKEFKQARANLGTMTSHIKNAISGVTLGFSKILELEGVGYRAAIEGKTLVMSLGFSHPIRLESPKGITIIVEKNQITVSGVDKQAVGQIAAEIRSFRKPEPYKGKGIHYKGEVIRRKSGKKAATTT